MRVEEYGFDLQIFAVQRTARRIEEPRAMAKKVTVKYQPDHVYSQLLTAGQHAFVGDEPVEGGGEGLGPSPYELLLWALGSCTVSTLLMYARRKGWDLTDVSVHLTHDRVPAKDSSSPQGEPDRVEQIKRDISVRGDLSDEQRARLLEIAGRCPVNRTLNGSPRVVDSIAAAA